MLRRNAIAASVASAMALASIAVTAYTVTDDGSRDDAVGELAAARQTTETVVKDEYIDDVVYATSDTVPTTLSPGAPGAPATTAAPGEQAAAPPGDVGAASAGDTAGPPAGATNPHSTTSPSRTGSPNGQTPTTTTSPPRATTTTQPPSAPPTTWPPGTELPEAWPAGVPYPPIPAGCRKPHLEDNGVWNCEH